MIEVVRLEEANGIVLHQINALLSQVSTRGSVSLVLLGKVVNGHDSELWIIRDGEHIIGMATLIGVYTLSGLRVHVDLIVVDERYRGKGLGRAIMEKLIERAKVRKAVAMDLTSNPTREAANALYLKLGFEQRETNVYRLKF